MADFIGCEGGGNTRYGRSLGMFHIATGLYFECFRKAVMFTGWHSRNVDSVWNDATSCQTCAIFVAFGCCYKNLCGSLVSSPHLCSHFPAPCTVIMVGTGRPRRRPRYVLSPRSSSFIPNLPLNSKQATAKPAPAATPKRTYGRKKQYVSMI